MSAREGRPILVEMVEKFDRGCASVDFSTANAILVNAVERLEPHEAVEEDCARRVLPPGAVAGLWRRAFDDLGGRGAARTTRRGRARLRAVQPARHARDLHRR